MKPEITRYITREYIRKHAGEGAQYLHPEKRGDLEEDEVRIRIIEVRLAKELGWFERLPSSEQEVLNRLFPEDLKLPSRIEVAKALGIPWQTAYKLERLGFRMLDKLFEAGPYQVKR